MKDTRKALWLVLLLVAVLCGVVLLWPKPLHTTPFGPDQPVPDSEPAVELLPSKQTGAADPDASRPMGAPAAQTAPTPQPTQHRFWHVSVCTVSPDGLAVPDINLEYIVVSHRELELMSNAEKLAIVWTPTTTDSTGRVVVECKGVSQETTYLVVLPMSLTWHLVEGRRNLLTKFDDAESYIIRGDDRVEVRLSRTNRIRLNVHYADGVQFSGRVKIVFLGPSTGRAGTPQFLGERDCLISADVSSDVEYPENAVSARLRIVGLRFGYLNTFTSNVELGIAARTLDVTIPPTELPWAGVHLDLSEFASGNGWSISLSGDGSVISDGVLEWGRAYDNYALHPDRDLIVRLSGPLGVWESGVFQLAKDEVREFRPVVAAPVSIHLRIVNEEGVPQYPGFVSSRLHDMTRWQTARAKGAQILIPAPGGETIRAKPDHNGIQAFAAKDGTVELAGVAPTVSQLFVEAPGSERTRVQLTARAGDTLDLGDVVVVPAQGEITIRFLNLPANVVLKTCMIKMPVVGDIEIVPAAATQYTFKNVSIDRGKYVAWVSRGQGYRPVQVEVSISADSPRAEIEIDINDMKPDVGMTTKQDGEQH